LFPALEEDPPPVCPCTYTEPWTRLSYSSSEAEAGSGQDAPSGLGGIPDWIKWAAGVIAAILATAGAYWLKQWRRFKSTVQRTGPAVLTVSGQVGGALSDLPSATPAARALGKGVAGAATIAGGEMTSILENSPDVVYDAKRAQLGLAALEYTDDPERLNLVNELASSGNKGAVIKAGNLIKSQGASATTSQQLVQIMQEFGLRP
jgi:hypothetical protein